MSLARATTPDCAPPIKLSQVAPGAAMPEQPLSVVASSPSSGRGQEKIHEQGQRIETRDTLKGESETNQTKTLIENHILPFTKTRFSRRKVRIVKH